MSALMSRTLRTASAAALIAASASASAHAATPSVSNYEYTGPLTVWIEPKPADYPNTPWDGCVVSLPKLTLDAVSAGKSASLQFRPFITWRGGVTLPIAGIPGFLRTNSWPLGDGPRELPGYAPLGLDDFKIPAPFPSNAADRGRVTLTGQVVYPQRWGGVNIPVFKALPTRSVPFSKVAKPAGACKAAGTQSLVSLSVF